MDEQGNAESEIKIREFSCSDNVGFDSLPYQIVKSRMQKGFVFNILLIGETGIGKSTLICSLFNIPPDVSPDIHVNSEVKLKCQTYKLQENGVNLKLTIVETIGYGDRIDRHDDVTPISNYIDCQFEKFFQEEVGLKRSLDLYEDTRVHACLYFICPTGHNLKAIDLSCLKQLQGKVNLIPIVAKSDSLSKEELRRFKMAINEEFEKEDIKICRFPDGDEENVEVSQKLNDLIPFAIAASKDYARTENKLKRARIFPWGTMFVENEEHNEFLVLKRALIEVNMLDLTEKTHTELYENFRQARMIQLGFPTDENFRLHEFLRNKREELRRQMKEKEEKLQERFIEKVKAKEAELGVQENALRSKYSDIFEKMESEQQELHALNNVLDQEILSFKKISMEPKKFELKT